MAVNQRPRLLTDGRGVVGETGSIETRTKFLCLELFQGDCLDFGRRRGRSCRNGHDVRRHDLVQRGHPVRDKVVVPGAHNSEQFASHLTCVRHANRAVSLALLEVKQVQHGAILPHDRRLNDKPGSVVLRSLDVLHLLLNCVVIVDESHAPDLGVDARVVHK